MRLRWEPCAGEWARITFYSRWLTWSLGLFRYYDINNRWGWKPNDGLDDGVLWFRWGSLFVHHHTKAKEQSSL